MKVWKNNFAGCKSTWFKKFMKLRVKEKMRANYRAKNHLNK